jgi:predicted dehydrogenase
MKNLIVGMGIGALYKTVLTELGHEVVTVDTVKPADFKSVGLAIDAHKMFDATFICTPNHTHEQIAYLISEHSRMVLIEKPGVRTARDWEVMVKSCPETKFMMIKNNQYRDDIELYRDIASKSTSIDIKWINYNRVPGPGTWFTNNHYSFGGVSRDLMPHLLSLVAAIKPDNYQDCNISNYVKEQRWKLEHVLDTDYGVVNPDGLYDVDDYCRIRMVVDNLHFNLVADWRSMTQNDQSISFFYSFERRFGLGLCPESAYKKMIETAYANIDNDAWWKNQLEQDLWIHNMIGPYDEK